MLIWFRYFKTAVRSLAFPFYEFEGVSNFFPCIIYYIEDIAEGPLVGSHRSIPQKMINGSSCKASLDCCVPVFSSRWSKRAYRFFFCFSVCLVRTERGNRKMRTQLMGARTMHKLTFDCTG